MQRKTLILLAAITVPVAGLAIFLPSGGGAVAPAAAGGAVFPSMKDWLGSAASLTVVGSDGSVTLARSAAAGAKPDEGWTLADKGNYPVPVAKVRPVLDGLVALHEIEPKTERPKLYGRLDLDDPGKESHSHSIALADAKGAPIVKLVVGKRREAPLPGGAEEIYVRKTDDARTWLAEPAITLPDDALGWIDRSVVDIDPAKVKSMVLTPAGGKPLEVSRDKETDKLAIKDLPKDAKLKAEDPAGDVAGAAHFLDLDDVKSAAKLAGTPAATVHVVTFDGLTADLTLVKQDNQTWVTVAATGTGDAAKEATAITDRTHGWAYEIPEARALTLESKLADLLAPPPAKPEPGKAEPGKPEAGKMPTGRPVPVETPSPD